MQVTGAQGPKEKTPEGGWAQRHREERLMLTRPNSCPGFPTGHRRALVRIGRQG